MRNLIWLLIFGLIVSISGLSYAAEDDKNSDTASSALGSAVMGGLLGGGLGAAIGSASGNAGKGALIGAGVGAVGGTLLGASQESKRRAQERSEIATQEPDVERTTSQNMKVKKRIIREYDDEGNVISEKEVKNCIRNS